MNIKVIILGLSFPLKLRFFFIIHVRLPGFEYLKALSSDFYSVLVLREQGL